MTAILEHLRAAAWAGALMLIGLYLFLAIVAGVSPTRAIGSTAVVALLAVAASVRGLRIAFESQSRGGNPHVRRAMNRERERRGF